MASLLEKLARAAKKIYPGRDGDTDSTGGDVVTLRPKRPVDVEAARVFDESYRRSTEGGYGSDLARKRAYDSARQFYRSQGFGENDASAKALKIKRDKAGTMTPVIISILILFAAYLISNWSTYSSIISSYFLVR